MKNGLIFSVISAVVSVLFVVSGFVLSVPFSFFLIGILGLLVSVVLFFVFSVGYSRCDSHNSESIAAVMFSNH